MKKICNTATALLFLLIVFGFALAFILVPDRAVSEEENRVLAQFPEFSLSSVASGAFNDGMIDYFADQFPARNTLVGLKAAAETALGRGENNGVLIGKHGQLAARRFKVYESVLHQTPDMDYYYESNVSAAIDALNAYAAAESRPVVTVLPPRTVDVAASALTYPGEITDRLHAQLTEGLTEETGFLDLLPLFRERYDAGEYVYFRTDHHWTPAGAYLAYREILKGFGMESEILPESAFTKEDVPGFTGTTWSRGRFKSVGPDTITLWNPDNMDEFETSCLAVKVVRGEDGKQKRVKEIYKTFPGWLNREYFDTKDKYAAFLDGTHSEQFVLMPALNGEREKLLIMKDSFANTLVPYLAEHFDLAIGNLSAGVTDASALAEEYGCSRVLIVYNWENLITSGTLGGIK